MSWLISTYLQRKTRFTEWAPQLNWCKWTKLSNWTVGESIFLKWTRPRYVDFYRTKLTDLDKLFSVLTCNSYCQKLLIVLKNGFLSQNVHKMLSISPCKVQTPGRYLKLPPLEIKRGVVQLPTTQTDCAHTIYGYKADGVFLLVERRPCGWFTANCKPANVLYLLPCFVGYFKCIPVTPFPCLGPLKYRISNKCIVQVL